MAGLTAVVFDLGGVVTGSPLQAIARYERDHGLPPNAINRVVAATSEHGAWARLERGELTVERFIVPFEADCLAREVRIDGARLMAYITEAGRARPEMLEAIRRLADRGLRVAALTNNWLSETPRTGPHPLRRHFHVFVESSAVGLREPDPRIYRLVCGELGVEPAQAAFLDDIGTNLKAARALGMTTIKVDEPGAALRELGERLGIDLL